MIAVEIGSSVGGATDPKLPPAAPLVASLRVIDFQRAGGLPATSVRWRLMRFGAFEFEVARSAIQKQFKGNLNPLRAISLGGLELLRH
jgi:hypothetical protein